jgi:hypothetical protein
MDLTRKICDEVAFWDIPQNKSSSVSFCVVPIPFLNALLERRLSEKIPGWHRGLKDGHCLINRGHVRLPPSGNLPSELYSSCPRLATATKNRSHLAAVR